MSRANRFLNESLTVPTEETTPLIARCTCGSVELEATGAPISCVLCFCKDCRAGAEQIEALPKASRVSEPEGGVAYVVYRKDRVQILKGVQFLQSYKIRQKSATNRIVATCCNAALILTFDDSKHWVDVYRMRVVGHAPPLQMQVCTRYRPSGAPIANVPASARYPIRLLAKLVAARLAMLRGP